MSEWQNKGFSPTNYPQQNHEIVRTQEQISAQPSEVEQHVYPALQTMPSVNQPPLTQAASQPYIAPLPQAPHPGQLPLLQSAPMPTLPHTPIQAPASHLPFAPPPSGQNFSSPPAYKAQGTVSKSVFSLSILLTILLTTSFTLGLAYALDFARTKNGIDPGTGTTQVQTNETDTGGQTVIGPDDIVLDGVVIKVDPNARETVKAKAHKLGQMLKAYEDNFYRELSSEELLEAMTAGVPSNLGNPYSYYLTAEEFASMQESNSGHYSGIGARISQNLQGGYELIDITPNSPAAEGGLQPGDFIIAVGEKQADEFVNTTALANEVKGEEGTTVQITIYRPSEARTFDVELTRRSIESIYITHRMLNDDIGYLSISEFTSTMPEQFAEAITDLVNKKAKSVIFDLRNNPGGDAWAVQQILDMLLPEGTIASIKGRDQGEFFEETWTSSKGELVPEDMQFAILVNNNSASASELFSGAMRDRLQTPIIGEQTYGKGSGTRFYTLEDGSAVNVTIFLYYFPGGETPEGEGIKPDTIVKLPDSALGKVISQLSAEEDTQLAEAIKQLSK